MSLEEFKFIIIHFKTSQKYEKYFTGNAIYVHVVGPFTQMTVLQTPKQSKQLKCQVSPSTFLSLTHKM